jgi:hypothetical protein
VKHAKEVLGISFVANHQPAKIVQPSKYSLNLSATAIPPQSSCVLGFVPAVAAVWSNQFNSVLPKFCVQRVGIIGVVSY